MNEQLKHDDEIDLLSLIKSVVATRVHLVIAMIVVSAAFWAGTVTLSFVNPPLNTANINFYFTFKGTEKSQYPNESPFQLSDVIAPVILNKVYDDIEAAGFIDRDQFVSGFTISPYIPDLDLINAKYDLDKSNLSQADLERMQMQLRREINQASSSAAQLQFVTTDASIPKELLRHALKSVPTAWAEHMVNNVGVVEFDITMFSDRAVDKELIKSMDFLIGFEMILDKIKLMKRNLHEVMELPNGQVTADSKSGLTAPDLERSLIDMEKYLVAPILTPIRNLGISKDAAVVKLYFEDQLQDLKRSRDLADKKRKNLEDAYATYVNNQGQQPGAASNSGGLGNSGSVIPQFGAEFLDRIVELTSSGVDIDFRQEMTEKQIELANELAEIESEFTRITQLIEAIENPDQSSSELSQRYIQRAEEQLPSILDKLTSYFDISNRIYQTVNANALGNAGSMYRLVSNDVEFNSVGPILNQSNFRLYLILLFLTTVLVIPLSMIHSAMKSNSE